ncbi:MAG TPA: PhzF family phenazine biosynthesis protein [Candidatus Binataceae bacterium]|nr:PhzF family phenazine biosynthesis protein [Candidatus Binataceae bacterium]
MRRYPFVTIDVFSSTPLAGNPLAVFTDARGLSDAEMQALAREMNLSETTFVFPREAALERERGVQVRIFTIAEELPFAGHPTLGTAYVIARAQSANRVVLDLKIGPVPVNFEHRNGLMFGEMTQREPEFGQTHRAEDVAQASGVALDVIDASLPIQTVSTGVPFSIVPLKSIAAVQALRIDIRRASAYLEKMDAFSFYFVTREVEDQAARLHARMQFIGGDDPATGSAAGCTAAWMVRNGVAQPEEQVLIEQGIEANRPSQIFVRASKTGDQIHNVRVAGHVAEIITGEATLP